ASTPAALTPSTAAAVRNRRCGRPRPDISRRATCTICRQRRIRWRRSPDFAALHPGYTFHAGTNRRCLSAAATFGNMAPHQRWGLTMTTAAATLGGESAAKSREAVLAGVIGNTLE